MGACLKLFVCFFVFSGLVALIQGEGCIYINGKCAMPCPPETHSYMSPCGTGQTMSQRTCRSPEPRDIGQYCDLSRCDCDEPKVWDQAASKCVSLVECSDQSNVENTSFE